MRIGNLFTFSGSGRTDDEEELIRTAVRKKYGINCSISDAFDNSLCAECENGTFVARQFGSVAVYRGIPYALPPVGKLRWKRPLPPEESSCVYEAYYNGRSSIQTERGNRASYYPQSEDCLYLNVWSNLSHSGENRPVMVFFHGGAFGWGGTADPMYDGRNFVTENPDILLVTVGYRTGIMGFVDFDGVPGGDNYPDSPNLGILDQIEALKWLKRNARAFGGDPDNVTIFGESAGGASVSLLAVIQEARGLFRRIIAQSGSVAMTFSKAQCHRFTAMLLRETGAKTMDELVSMSEGRLREVNERLNSYCNFPQRDGVLIPKDPFASYASGDSAGTDILVGSNANEINYWIGIVGGIIPFGLGLPIKFENDLRLISDQDRKRINAFFDTLRLNRVWRIAEFYNEVTFRLPALRQADYHAQCGGKSYVYYWAEPSALPFRGACHAAEMSYVFGNIDETVVTGRRADSRLSRLVMKMWANFARCGDPSADGISWPQYTPDDHASMVLEKDAHPQRDIMEESRRILDPLTGYMTNPSLKDLDLNVPFVRKTLAAGATAAAALIAAGLIVSKNRSDD